MFSSMLQNLLNSSGQANAMQRAVQMNSYIQKYNAQWQPVEKKTDVTSEKPIQSFDTVLKNSSKVKFGDLLKKPETKVSAALYTAQANSAHLSPRQKISEIISGKSEPTLKQARKI